MTTAAISNVSSSAEILHSLGVFTSKPVTSVDGLLDFYKTGDELYVGTNFIQLLELSNPIPSDGIKYAQQVVISRNNVLDSDVVSSFAGNFAFKLEEFFGFLADLIADQLGGKSGRLTNSGYSNVFFIRRITGHVTKVTVLYSTETKKWHIHECRFDELVNYPQDTIFFCL